MVMPMLADYYYDHRCHQLLPKASKPQSKHDRDTFEGYLRHQGTNPTTTSPEALASFRDAFEEWQKKKATTPKPGRMKLRDLKPGEQRYAVAVRERSELFMTLFIRRDPKGDVYVMIPRGRGSGNPHASYHRDETFHHKRGNRAMMQEPPRQPLTAIFKGCEHMGMFGGHAPKIVGVTCDPAKLTGIIELQDEALTSTSKGRGCSITTR